MFNLFQSSFVWWSLLIVRKSGLKNINNNNNCHKFLHTSQFVYHFRPDKSRLPILKEEDLEEQFVQGTGPGGQNVNRLQNCVVLKHKPTGLVVKCHQDRLLQKNRKIARRLLLERLDQYENDENSLKEQKKRYIQTGLKIKEKRAEELRLKKLQYKQSLEKKQQQSNSNIQNYENNHQND